MPSEEIAQKGIDWIAAAGTVAQVVVAVAAVYVASRANKIAHEATFVQRAIDELVDLRTEAQKIHLLYRRLFEPFSDRDAKVAARNEWVRSRDALSLHLEYVICAFPELETLRKPWQELDEEEDSHTLSDAVLFAGNRGIVTKKHERLCAEFIRRTAESIKSLRAK